MVLTSMDLGMAIGALILGGIANFQYIYMQFLWFALLLFL